MKRTHLQLVSVLAFLLGFTVQVNGQVNLHSEDLPRFYTAFDSVMTTTDTLKQADFIQRLYVDKASPGLKKFMELRGGHTQAWRKFIDRNKASLIEKRPWILSVLRQEPEIRNRIALFKKHYPDFREGDIYFCVGIGNSGGTIYDRTVYIGTEVASGNTPDWAVYLVLHEFTHTQQWTQRNINALYKNKTLGQEYERTHQNLLGKALEEGMADFVAELILGKQLATIHPDSYIAFGLKHEKSIWHQFKKRNECQNKLGTWLAICPTRDRWRTHAGFGLFRWLSNLQKLLCQGKRQEASPKLYAPLEPDGHKFRTLFAFIRL